MKSNPIIPNNPVYYKIAGSTDWDYKAICVFVATGFFLDRDTYFQNKKVVPPATEYSLDSEGYLVDERPYFSWHHSPMDIDFQKAVTDFSALFEDIIRDQVGDQKVILPLSGGLDSRTQAVALQYLGKEVQSYSYQFDGGYAETRLGKAVAEVAGFPFKKYIIPKGYLWKCIDELAAINNCYSEFTHPRQMAIFNQYGSMGDIFSLGHWGDVLFDRGIKDGVQETDFPGYILKKIVKKGGMELAESLWKAWGLSGEFKPYLQGRVEELWDAMPMDNLSARMRAFKSRYWAPRWTSTNLSIFEAVKPITLPYYDNRMCEFICTIPEEFLADRKIQIAYIKNRSPKIAKVVWQDHKPFHLGNYHLDKSPFNLPYRIQNKLKRELRNSLGSPFIQRNWELQFVGEQNRKQLEGYLDASELREWVPKSVIDRTYHKFLTENKVEYSHPVSMLLTLALKSQMNGPA